MRAALSEHLGDLASAARARAVDADPGGRFRHHLLVRWMYEPGESGTHWEAYSTALGRLKAPARTRGEERS